MFDYQLPLKVHEYLAGVIDIPQLEEWIASRAPVLYDSSISKDLIGTIELDLCELAEGIISEEDLKRSLLKATGEMPLYVFYPTQHSATRSTCSNELFTSLTQEERTEQGSIVHVEFACI